jgi:hypothetical protein
LRDGSNGVVDGQVVVIVTVDGDVDKDALHSFGVSSFGAFTSVVNTQSKVLDGVHDRLPGTLEVGACGVDTVFHTFFFTDGVACLDQFGEAAVAWPNGDKSKIGAYRVTSHEEKVWRDV